MSEGIGVAAAVLSSGLGGTAIGATRLLAGRIDPVTLGFLRFAVGAALLVPVALLAPRPWPRGRDRAKTAALGLLFFAVFPCLFNAALALTSAARGALALSTLPLLTMAVAAILGVERLTLRKSAGVAVAMGGVLLALASGLSLAPPGAWRGDLLMAAGAFCMAFYNVWSRPLIRRSAVLPYTATGMACGAGALFAVSLATGGAARLSQLAAAEWLAVAYLGIVGAAVTFWLWAWALDRATPTRVATTVTVNPVTAAIFGLLLLGEPVPPPLLGGLAAVAVGIWIASRPG